MIYLIRESLGGFYKIGVSDDPWKRVSKIQSDCPGDLTVCAILEGGEEEEAALHERFSEHRARGEWFRPAPALVEFAAQHSAPARPGGRNPLGPKAIADAVGISKSYASMILGRKQPASLHVAVKIFDATGEWYGKAAKVSNDDVDVLRRFFEGAA
jgi:hypothetical protein